MIEHWDIWYVHKDTSTYQISRMIIPSYRLWYLCICTAHTSMVISKFGVSFSKDPFSDLGSLVFTVVGSYNWDFTSSKRNLHHWVSFFFGGEASDWKNKGNDMQRWCHSSGGKKTVLSGAGHLWRRWLAASEQCVWGGCGGWVCTSRSCHTLLMTWEKGGCIVIMHIVVIVVLGARDGDCYVDMNITSMQI